MPTRLSLVAAVLGAVMMSGCTVATAGTPQAASTKTSEPSGGGPSADLPSDGAPKVDNPLDVSHFEEEPCDALAAEDAKELNVPTPGKQSNNGVGQSCDWVNTQTGGALRLTFFSDEKSGLSSLYREAKAVGWPLFERVGDVEGHPAVAYSTSEAEPTYTCVVAVGLSDQLAFSTYATLSNANVGKRKPCEAAADAAGRLLRTMEAA